MIGKKTSLLVMACILGQMEDDIKEIGRIIRCMVKVNTPGKMVESTTETIKMT